MYECTFLYKIDWVFGESKKNSSDIINNYHQFSIVIDITNDIDW